MRDVLQHWDVRRWLNLIDQLPRGTAYQEALALDEDYARQVVADEATAPAGGRHRPSLREWDGVVEVLADLHDRVVDLVNVNAQKRTGLRYYPRPATAVEQARKEWVDRQITEIAEDFGLS